MGSWRSRLLESGVDSFLRFGDYSPPEVDRIWLCVHHNKFAIYPMFYLILSA